MRIIGIDPGLNRTGYGIIEERSGHIVLLEAGFIRTSAKDHIAQRLERLYRGLSGLIEEYTPDVMVLEKLYSHYKHPTTSILMAHARGVICLVCGLRAVALVNYPSTKVKKSITGNGHASKSQMQRMIQSILNLPAPPDPSDIADALALAACHVYIHRKKGLL